MLRFPSYDIVFQEVPDEVTLAINISNCPYCCKGCHSPHLQINTGELLNQAALTELLTKYGEAVTCVCFMGGDADPKEVERAAAFIQKTTNNRIKCAWYSGKAVFPEECSLQYFDYIKLGPYVDHLGGLDSPMTNQRFYRIENGKMVDMTSRFTNKRDRHIRQLANAM
jgi:anaerobic ribonucleoside-triphosphate reductase activating protein